MRGRAFGQLFDGLAEGDPVAWGGVIFFALLAAGFGIAILVVKRKHQREDDERARRYGRR